MANNFKVNIAKLRKERAGLTQEEFAQKLDRSVDTIGNYERGKTGSDVIQLVVKMCEILRCRVDELIEYIDDDDESISKNSDVDDEPQPENPYDVLRRWWQRVIPNAEELGGKEIEEVIDILKKRNEFIKILKIFVQDEDLDKRFKSILSEYENEQQTRCDELSEDRKGEFEWDRLNRDPNRCAGIYYYLIAKDDKFLPTLKRSLRKIVEKALTSS